MTPASEDVLLVTGGGRGIGAAIARGAVRQGYAVCFSYLRDAVAANTLLAQLHAGGGRALALQGDVGDSQLPRRMFDAAESQFGPVTALVNNAGITGWIAPFVEQSVDTLRRTIDVNVLGTMTMAQEAVRRWTARGTAGRMVNISSAAATLGSPHEYVHYAASKAAVEAFTLGLGKELGASGIRINAVAPGMTDTDIHAAGGQPERLARVVSRVPLGRAAQPEEIASTVLWLLSSEASYITGAVLRVAGGL